MDTNYRQMMLNKMRQQQADKGKTGLGRKAALDFSKAVGKTVNMWMPKYKDKGENAFDILPFVITQEWYSKLRMPTGRVNGLMPGMIDQGLTIPVHKNVGINNDIFLCPREAFGDGCPICDEMFEAYKAGDKDKASKLRPSWRSFYNVYDYDDTSKGIQLFEISYYMFESTGKNDLQRCNLMDAAILDPSGPIIFADLQEGKTIVATFKKRTLDKAEWAEVDSIKFEDREPYPESILQQVFPLDMMVVRASFEEMKNSYFGLDANSSDHTETKLPETKSVEQPPAQVQHVEEVKKEEIKTTVGDLVRSGRTRNFDTAPEKVVEVAGPVCPAGRKFGVEFNSTAPECEGKTVNSCEEAMFNECMKAFNKINSGSRTSVVEEKKEVKPEADPPPPWEEAKPTQAAPVQTQPVQPRVRRR